METAMTYALELLLTLTLGGFALAYLAVTGAACYHAARRHILAAHPVQPLPTSAPVATHP